MFTKENYTPENLDLEVLDWYARINLNRLGDALNELDSRYDPTYSNPEFRISSRLQRLAELGFGLWIKWAYKAHWEEEGFVSSFGRDPEACSVKQDGKFGFIGVRYEYIKEVALRMPLHQATPN